jgi:hypothetical protein
MPERDQTRDPLSPYPELIDLCHAQGYRVHLDWGRDGWTLDVFEGGGLIARSTSTKAPPACFRELAANAAAGLSRAGKSGHRRGPS